MAIDASGRARLLVQEILHPDEMDRFVAGCVPTDAADFAGLRLRTKAYVAWARTAAEPETSAVDLDTAVAIANALLVLLDEPDQFDAEQRALLHGAVDYFIESDDSDNDLTNVLGFDDDVRVLNAVLEAIGRRDLLVELG